MILHHLRGDPASCGHPGLAWRFGGNVQPTTAEEKKANLGDYRSRHVANLTGTPQGQRAYSGNSTAHLNQYKAAYERRETWLRSNGVELQQLTFPCRLYSGLGDAGVFETQASLHPVTGMPRLPGSAVKGVLHKWVMRQLGALDAAAKALPGQVTQSTADLLFGADPLNDDPGLAGSLVFHDAWWDPSSVRGPLEAEIVTPHHTAYYAGTAVTAEDTDSPVPSAQLAIAGNLMFAIGQLDGNKAWATIAMAWLQACLADSGIGGHTAVGYGQARPPGPEDTRPDLTEPPPL
jgi:CRISPR-associated protein Cmr6